MFSAYYPSQENQDWAWMEYTKSLDQGVTIQPLAKHTATVVGTNIYIYGGIADWNLDSVNSMYKIDS